MDYNYTICQNWAIYLSTNNCAGLVGVNNISCNLNIDSNCGRVWSTMLPYIKSGGTYDVFDTEITDTTILGTKTASAFTATKLLFNFLSSQPEQLF